LKEKLNRSYIFKLTKLILIAFLFHSCSTNINQVFKEEPSAKEGDSVSVEVSPEIAEAFKVETSSEKKEKKIKTKKKKEVLKNKPELLPPELAKLYEPIDLNSKEVWKSFVPYATNEEETLMKVAFFGITVGFMKITIGPMVQVKNTKAYHLTVKLKSADFYSFIYSLDNTVESFVDAKTIIPLKYTLLQRESKQNVDDFQVYDVEKRQTHFWYKREKLKTKEVQKKNDVGYLTQYFQDSLSSLFFTRGLPLAPGKVLEFPLVNKGKTVMVKIKVVGIEDIKINKKFQKAFRIEASSYPLEGEKKDEYVLFWYSLDPEKRLLKFSAKVKFGDVSGEMVDYKQGAPLNLNDK
jgi:Protein of unknown function (DUF3108)